MQNWSIRIQNKWTHFAPSSPQRLIDKRYQTLFKWVVFLGLQLTGFQCLHAQPDARTSHSSNTELVAYSGMLTPQGPQLFPFNISSQTEKLLVSVNAIDLASIGLIRPDGSQVFKDDRNVRVQLQKTAAIYELTDPVAGDWNLKVEGIGEFTINAFSSSYSAKPEYVATTENSGRAWVITQPPSPRSGLIPVSGTLITTGTALSKSGKPVIWGFRGSSQQGNGRRVITSYEKPETVNSLNQIVSLVGGAYHLLAMDQDGNVTGWGQSGYGETGCNEVYPSTPCKVLGNAVQIATGEYFSIALDKDGRVWTWGHNLYGQLGNGRFDNSRTPIIVNLRGEKARLIGGAYEGAFAVTEEGNVWAWGDNEASGLGFQGPSYGIQSIVRTPTRIPNLKEYAKRMTYIAGGNGWGEALLDDGTVIGWGLHASLGQGTMLTSISGPEPVIVMHNVKHLFARYVGSVALTTEGQIFTWGQTGGSAFPFIYGASPIQRNSVGPVTDIGGGKEHIFYKTEDGAMYGVGYNDLNKLSVDRCCAPSVEWPGIEFTFEQAPI